MKTIKNPLDREAQLYQLLHSGSSEEEVYQSYFTEDLWSVHQFASLMAGLTPERSTKLINNPSKQIADRDLKKCRIYIEIKKKIIETCLENEEDNFNVIEGQFYMTTCKLIKWAAENSIPLIGQFLNNSPLFFLQTYREFQPTALRTAHKNSREYHQAIYLKKAEELLTKNPCLSITELYNHPHMQNIKRWIRDLGGKYKERTYRDSWLSKLFDNKLGRPKKKN